jgi:hypothetical protein
MDPTTEGPRLYQADAWELFRRAVQATAWASAHGWPDGSSLVVRRRYEQYQRRLNEDWQARRTRRGIQPKATKSAAPRADARPRSDRRVVLRIAAGTWPQEGGDTA